MRFDDDSAYPTPFFRFSLRYCMSPGEVHGPRITYIPSLNLIESGAGELITANGRIALRPGVQIYMVPGKRHAWKASQRDPFVYRIVFFEWNYRERPGIVYPNDFLVDPHSRLVEEYIAPPIAHAFPEYTVLEDMKEWIRRFTPIHSNYEVYDRSRFPGSLRMQGDFLLFMDYVLNHAMAPKVYGDRHVRRFVKAIAEGDRTLLEGTVEEWTAANGISRSHFHHRFKQQMGATPHAYLTGRRIVRTFEELIGNSATITAIAEKHGFRSVHHYAKLFLKETGLTPGEFRRRNRLNG